MCYLCANFGFSKQNNKLPTNPAEYNNPLETSYYLFISTFHASIWPLFIAVLHCYAGFVSRIRKRAFWLAYIYAQVDFSSKRRCYDGPYYYLFWHRAGLGLKPTLLSTDRYFITVVFPAVRSQQNS